MTLLRPEILERGPWFAPMVAVFLGGVAVLVPSIAWWGETRLGRFFTVLGSCGLLIWIIAFLGIHFLKIAGY
ncbi:MAG: hypothetical protein HY006_01660 [Candidatus Sungbacteria bacterium]|nr:hypothetical protein [Candidatus Sungbacteria bacterium]